MGKGYTHMETNEIAERFIKRWLALQADKQRLLPDRFTRVDKISAFMRRMYEEDMKTQGDNNEVVVRHFAYRYVLPIELGKQLQPA